VSTPHLYLRPSKRFDITRRNDSTAQRTENHPTPPEALDVDGTTAYDGGGTARHERGEHPTDPDPGRGGAQAPHGRVGGRPERRAAALLQAAFGTYLLASVLGRFPREIVEAARMDGANAWQVLWRIVVPVSRPTLGVLLVFFIWTWNEFLLPLVMLISNDNQTVSVALGVLQGQRLMDATMTNAAALLGVLPALVFFLVFQRILTRGIAVRAVRAVK
jgi:hypothetical protein